jgi:hypothetical protein
MFVHVDFTVSKVLKEQVSVIHHFILPFIITILRADTEYAVAQMVEALHYKQEGCGFDSRQHMALGSTKPLI